MTPVGGAHPRRATPLVVVVGAVSALALVLAAIHGIEQPAWAYEDEQQHVDLALKLADGRVAHLEDLIEASVVRSTLDTGRFTRLADLTNDDPAAWGLEGRSYMGFHPPLAQALLAPFSAAVGRDAFRTMAIGRGIAAVLVAATTALVALLAARWRPERPATAAAMAGIAFGTLPVVSDLGGRWSNDVVALALVVASCLVAVQVADAVAETGSVSTRRLLLLSAALAAAVSAKATGWVAVPAALLVAGPAVVSTRGWRALAAVLAAPVVATAAWLGVLWARYGTLDGSAAFRDTYGGFYPGTSLLSSPLDAQGGARLLLHRSLLPLHDLEWGLSDWVPLAIGSLLLAGVVGVVLERRAQPLLALVGVAVPGVVLLEVVLREGQNSPSGRFVAASLAVGAAVAAGSWVRWAWFGWVPPSLSAIVGGWFVVAHRWPW